MNYPSAPPIETCCHPDYHELGTHGPNCTVTPMPIPEWDDVAEDWNDKHPAVKEHLDGVHEGAEGKYSAYCAVCEHQLDAAAEALRDRLKYGGPA